jgi:diadenosine tetraphosphate (Ap4A) HIT family hydrolase
MDQPGWLTIQLRRHAEGLQFLTEDELVSFGPIAAKVIVAIQDVMGAERVYMIQLGETFRHFHVLFAPRNADTPIEHRGAALFVNRREYRNPARATAVAKSIRARLHN